MSRDFLVAPSGSSSSLSLSFSCLGRCVKWNGGFLEQLRRALKLLFHAFIILNKIKYLKKLYSRFPLRSRNSPKLVGGGSLKLSYPDLPLVGSFIANMLVIECVCGILVLEDLA